MGDSHVDLLLGLVDCRKITITSCYASKLVWRQTAKCPSPATNVRKSAPEELRQREKELLAYYCHFLGVSVFHRQAKGFWDYHNRLFREFRLAPPPRSCILPSSLARLTRPLGSRAKLATALGNSQSANPVPLISV